MIYFVQSGDAPFIKIGFADKWERRLASLQCGNPEKVSLIGFLPGGIKIERALHALLRKHRHRGEWFAYAPAMSVLARGLGGDADFVERLIERMKIEQAAENAAARREMALQGRAALKALQATLAVLVEDHGRSTVQRVMGYTTTEGFASALSSDMWPEAHRIFNLLTLDVSALDGLAAVYGFRFERPHIGALNAIVRQADELRGAA